MTRIKILGKILTAFINVVMFVTGTVQARRTGYDRYGGRRTRIFSNLVGSSVKMEKKIFFQVNILLNDITRSLTSLFDFVPCAIETVDCG